MKKRKSFWLCFLLTAILALSGCQTSSLREEQTSGESQEEADRSLEADSKEEDTRSSQEQNEKRPEYIDEAYVDAQYEDEEEDFSKYNSKASASSAETETSSKSSGQSSGAEQRSGNQNHGSGESKASADNYYTDPVPEGMPQPVEPQDEEVNTNTSLTCTMYVECSTILNNMDDLAEGKEELVPADGVIYSRRTVTFYQGESVYDLLVREMQNNRIHMEASFTPAYNSAYVEGINNLYEKECGRYSGWMYCVNGWYPNYGCSRYQIQSGDVIEWHYTCDLGRDLGR